jgi:glycosyltransferase involved in cell wall biosynthesis
MLKTKGVFDLLEACKILHGQGADFECRFVGSWHDIKEIEFFHFVNTNGLEQKVKFLGPQYGQDKDKALSQSDVLCLPTYYPLECFPLIILDGMRWGLPVISTDEGAIPEIIDDGVSGYVINKKAPEELAEKLAYLMQHDDVRKKMGDAGRTKFLERYTQPIFENTLCQILEKALAK